MFQHYSAWSRFGLFFPAVRHHLRWVRGSLLAQSHAHANGVKGTLHPIVSPIEVLAYHAAAPGAAFLPRHWQNKWRSSPRPRCITLLMCRGAFDRQDCWANSGEEVRQKFDLATATLLHPVGGRTSGSGLGRTSRWSQGQQRSSDSSPSTTKVIPSLFFHIVQNHLLIEAHAMKNHRSLHTKPP
jgi:hypothetical protein